MSNNRKCQCMEFDAIKLNMPVINKEIESVKMKCTGQVSKCELDEAFSDVEIKFIGESETETVSFAHNYCPFCGVKVNGGV